MLSLTDLKFSDEGDFVVGEDGDFVLSSGEQCLRESIYIRMKTDIGDWSIFPRLGASLGLLIGKKNNKESLNRGISNITSALTYDKMIPAGASKVTGFPAGNIIVFISSIKIQGETSLSFATKVDLDSGIEVI